MRAALLSIRLAARDWFHEYILSLCAVLALASMLTPLLVMNGVKVGLVESLRINLLQDPNALLIMPSGSGFSGYTKAQVESFTKRPDVSFAIPRTRSVAAELRFKGADGAFVPLSLEATAPGDPRLAHHNLPVPQADTPVSGMVLSASAARKLGAQKGQVLEANLGRKRPNGMLESLPIRFMVTGILPAEAMAQDTAFMPLSALEDIQDYRDYLAVPQRGFSGDTPGAEERQYESFRLYARTLEDVENLDRFFAAQGTDVLTEAKKIANIRKFNTAFAQIMLLISLAVGAGFVAFTVSSALAAVRRKDRMLGTLRLLGFSRISLLLYPMTQTLLTGFFGTLLAGIISGGSAFAINMFFSDWALGFSVCTLTLEHFCIALGLVLLLSTVASVHPALRAARIDPSLVIRDV